jgi:hypothetical protein
LAIFYFTFLCVRNKKCVGVARLQYQQKKSRLQINTRFFQSSTTDLEEKNLTLIPTGVTIYGSHYFKAKVLKKSLKIKILKNSYSLSILSSFILTSGIFLKSHPCVLFMVNVLKKSESVTYAVYG